MTTTTINTITFRTATQAAIFEHELKGQFSDGHWENCSHKAETSWRPWCRAKVLVGPNVGRNFDMWGLKDNYNLSSRELLEVVQHRMIGYAKLALIFGFEGMKEFEELVGCDGIECPRESLKGELWDARRKLYGRLISEVGSIDAISRVKYTEKDLLKDLREMKKAMKTIVQPDSTTV